MSPEPSPDDRETQFPTRTVEPADVGTGTIIGSYHLLQPIGHGGMGEVWLAEQKEPVRRRVAVKLIKAGMDTREVVARFESERQALALMDHPAIAKVFDAGSTPQGRPYFAMEFVSGLAITTYCDQHKLSTRQRLELFVAVCEGVQHAHQKAILHRDLKPSNILVGEVDGRPAPRIIDFGVAKATAQRLTADTMYTRVGAIVGTPGYMSPEQADSAGMDVDTRTDVYSLGVVLYELLVGALPLDFSTTPPDQFARRLRDEDAPRPSTRIRTLGAQRAVCAQQRGADAPLLAKQLRGDLDAIALKALEKDRARRYATPTDLAADIGRYLRNKPVQARPASTAYRARKYVRRHRLGVTVAAIAAVSLLAVAIAQAIELRRITRERDRADRVTAFMTSMFKVSNPSQARGNDIRAREILDKASRQIDTGLAKDPELQARMMHVMGSVYQSLGLYSEAESLLRHSVEIERRTLGENDPETLTSMHDLAGVLTDRSQYREAEAWSRQTLEARRRKFGAEHHDTLASQSMLAFVLEGEGHYPEAEKLNREVLGAARRASSPDAALIGLTTKRLAIDLAYEGKYQEGEALFRELLETDRRALGPDDPKVLADMNNLASILLQEHRYPEAEKLYVDGIAIKRRVLGPEHPNTVMSMGSLALTLLIEGRNQEAEKLFREVLEIKRRTLGPEHRSTLVTMGNVADLLSQEGRYPEAEKMIRQTLEIEQRTLGPAHSDTMATLTVLATVLKHEKRYAESEADFTKALEDRRAAQGVDHPETAGAAYGLARVQALDGKHEAALANLEFAVAHALNTDSRKELATVADLNSLHAEPRFQALIAAAQKTK